MKLNRECETMKRGFGSLSSLEKRIKESLCIHRPRRSPGTLNCCNHQQDETQGGTPQLCSKAQREIPYIKDFSKIFGFFSLILRLHHSGIINKLKKTPLVTKTRTVSIPAPLNAISHCPIIVYRPNNSAFHHHYRTHQCTKDLVVRIPAITSHQRDFYTAISRPLH